LARWTSGRVSKKELCPSSTRLQPISTAQTRTADFPGQILDRAGLRQPKALLPAVEAVISAGERVDYGVDEAGDGVEVGRERRGSGAGGDVELFDGDGHGCGLSTMQAGGKRMS
jgi:hypothetical protein